MDATASATVLPDVQIAAAVGYIGSTHAEAEVRFGGTPAVSEPSFTVSIGAGAWFAGLSFRRIGAHGWTQAIGVELDLAIVLAEAGWDYHVFGPSGTSPFLTVWGEVGRTPARPVPRPPAPYLPAPGDPGDGR